MSSVTITYIVAPLVSALIAGCAWLVKHYIEKSEERQRKKDEGPIYSYCYTDERG